MSAANDRAKQSPPRRSPKPPPDALEILGRWRLARLIGDTANANHALAQLRELAERPKRADGQSMDGYLGR